MNTTSASSPRRSGVGLSFRTVCATLLLGASLGALRAADTTIAWGNNNNLQSQVPVNLPSTVTLAAGTLHSLALKPDGTLISWGDNLFGQANVAGLVNVRAIAAGDTYSLILFSNGTVTVRGTLDAPPANLANVTAIAAGWKHSLALRADGTVVSWGDTNAVPEGLSNVVAIAAGDGHSLALLTNRTVVAWGDTNYNKTVVPAGLSNIVAIAAGKDHSVALRQDGRVFAWGRNDSNQAAVPTAVTNVAKIAAGALHTLALQNNGILTAWGDNTFAQVNVPNWDRFFDVAAGGYHNLGQIGDGTPVVTVQPRDQRVPVTGSATFSAMIVGRAPLAYQWQKDGTNLVGRTSNLLTLSNVQTNDAGSYRLVAANSNGLVTTITAELSPYLVPPTIVTQPQDIAITCGENATFRVTATGSQPLSYQWYYEASEVAGATRSSLVLTNIATTQAGLYYSVITNVVGTITSTVVSLTVTTQPPVITSSLSRTSAQGAAFSYKITATRSPILYAAQFLPPGLSLNPTNGTISGTPIEKGSFQSIITAINQCDSGSATLNLTFLSGAPVITSGTNIAGQEGEDLSFQIQATLSPTTFSAKGLPDGLTLNPLTGLITGQPVYAGDFSATITVGNLWGTSQGTLHFSFTRKEVFALSIANLTYAYSSPYVLDFQFSLRDSENPAEGNAVVVDPSLLRAVAYEGEGLVSTNETGTRMARGRAKQIKANLVLDFTESVASLANGDENNDGISDAIDNLVAGSQNLVNQLPASAQIGVYEFHREDFDPQLVQDLTTDKPVLSRAIAGIWTNYVGGFPASSRCWDAMTLAIAGLGATNTDEQHYVIFISDGRDESSTATINDVITAATNSGVKIYCIGFGNPEAIDTNGLTAITQETQGRFYYATNAVEVAAKFGEIGKDLNGQYILRWASLKRGSTPVMPKFQIFYGTNFAFTPTNPITEIPTNDPVDPTITITNYSTNFIIGFFTPSDHAGPVTVGALRLTPDAAVLPTSIRLRTAYTPRFIRQLRIHYRANWPCVPELLSTAPGEILAGWSMSETNDDAGGTWLHLSAAYPTSTTNSIPFAAFGDLVQFKFNDVLNPSNAFSLFAVDNTLYTNTGGQSFVIENTNAFVKTYTNLPYGTPVPWLIEKGITSNFEAAELADPDGDGVPTWLEYRGNTDPLSASSRFAIHPLGYDEFGRPLVTFTSGFNRRYRVESSTDLVTWNLVAEDITGTGGDITVLDQTFQPWSTQLYYRATIY